MSKKVRKTAIEAIRKQELVRAAHRVFIAHGLGGMTTARICEEAGMSPGILAYYFKGKDELMFWMVRYNNRILMEDVIARLRAARTRWERLMAIVDGNFPEVAYEYYTANAWLSICAAAVSKPEYGRLQSIFYKRLASNLASSLSNILTNDRQKKLSLLVSVNIDGLWLQKATGNPITRVDAVKLVHAGIEAFLTISEREALNAS